MAPKASMLKKILDGRSNNALSGLALLSGRIAQSQFERAFDDAANPKRRQLAKLSDEELAELLATEQTDSYLHHLAASVIRSRESWRTPARWALLVALGSMLISLLALWSAQK